jgi:hypothetical protein
VGNRSRLATAPNAVWWRQPAMRPAHSACDRRCHPGQSCGAARHWSSYGNALRFIARSRARSMPFLAITRRSSNPSRSTKPRILRKTGLTASAGISYNKFLARLASSQRKPNGQFVITPEMGPDFIASLPIDRFHGVGPVTATKVRQLGIQTGADLRAQSLAFLQRYFGRSAAWISALPTAKTMCPCIRCGSYVEAGEWPKMKASPSVALFTAYLLVKADAGDEIVIGDQPWRTAAITSAEVLLRWPRRRPGRRISLWIPPTQ